MAGGALMTQLAHANTASESCETALEEIVVTARKREERLKDMPVAITVICRSDTTAKRIIIPESLAAPGVYR
jgi:outer membrane cobalamin receptor